MFNDSACINWAVHRRLHIVTSDPHRTGLEGVHVGDNKGLTYRFTLEDLFVIKGSTHSEAKVFIK